MAYPPQNEEAMTDFQGLMTNVSLMDIPPGASDEQVNMCSITVGELKVRHGLRIVSFEE